MVQKFHTQVASKKSTPQSEPIPGTVPNNAGGHSFEVTPWMSLERFLILGTEGGTYYTGEKELTRKNAAIIEKCIALDGQRVVRTVVDFSVAGRAPKNDPALFVLALCSVAKDEGTRKAAYAALPSVARIGTHLFHFAQYRDALGGWGRGLRNAIASWYSLKELDDLAYQLVKYQQRDGWSHKDLLRLSHFKPSDTAVNRLMRWVVSGNDARTSAHEIEGKKTKGVHVRDGVGRAKLPDVVRAFEELKIPLTKPKDAAEIIREYNLPREAVPTELLKEVVVWEALLEKMPMTAMIRNLGTMSKIGLLKPNSAAEKKIIRALSDGEALKKSRVHPIQVLSAMMTYGNGKGVRSDAAWTVCPKVVDALDEAFYLSFGNVEPTGKRICLALDVSGSMSSGEIAGVPGLTPRIASSAMAMIAARTEAEYEVMAFSERFMPLNISPRQRLDDICAKTDRLPFSGTDCAVPMIWAAKEKRKFDAFYIYTDSETWFGDIHPAQALRKYRQEHVPGAKLIVVGMVANEFTIADPKDAGMLDVVGFDAGAPEVMSSFVRG